MVKTNQPKSKKTISSKNGESHLSETFSDINVRARSKPYSCKMCKTSFRSLLKFQEHATKHLLKGYEFANLQSSPHPCELCKHSFESYALLELHMLSHTGEKAHQCQLCSKRFGQKPHMTRHLKAVHTLEKPYKCNNCTKAFSRNDDLTRHKWIHSSENCFNCDQCSETFKTPYAARRHVQMQHKH